ncbi:MAG TPA: hypothetical protein PKH77_27725 [Anaerolineae bacterium]|nr:hypothetical protein [Anaerolineae bacterium]
MKSTSEWFKSLFLLLLLISGCATSSLPSAVPENGEKSHCVDDVCIADVQAWLSSDSSLLQLELYLTRVDGSVDAQLQLDNAVTIEIVSVESALVLANLTIEPASAAYRCGLKEDESTGEEVMVCREFVSLESSAREQIDQENTVEVIVHPYGVQTVEWVTRAYEKQTFKWWYLVFGVSMVVISGVMVYQAYVDGEGRQLFRHIIGGVGLGLLVIGQAFTSSQWRSLSPVLDTVLSSFFSVLALAYILMLAWNLLRTLGNREDRWRGD